MSSVAYTIEVQSVVLLDLVTLCCSRAFLMRINSVSLDYNK